MSKLRQGNNDNGVEFGIILIATLRGFSIAQGFDLAGRVGKVYYRVNYGRPWSIHGVRLTEVPVCAFRSLRR